MISPIPYVSSPFQKNVGFACQISEWSLEQIYPIEWELVKQAVPKRQYQFALGRIAARTALAQLAIPPQPILQGECREPLWPDGIVGSISHTGDIALASVAFRSEYDGIGLDIEEIVPSITWNLAKRISNHQEFAWLNEDPQQKISRFFTLFSAKESVFKAFFPQYKVFLEFQDVLLCWDACSSCFKGELCKQIDALYPVGYQFQVSSQIIGSYVVTAMTIPARTDIAQMRMSGTL